MRLAGGDPLSGESDWKGVAVLCRSADGHSLLMLLQGCPGEVPAWAVPGGSIEPGETPERAAVREAKEETGLDVRIVGPHAVVRRVRDDGDGPFMCRIHYFQAQVVGGAAHACDPDGLIHRVAWVPAARLPDLRLSHEDQRQILMAFMGDHNGRTG